MCDLPNSNTALPLGTGLFSEQSTLAPDPPEHNVSYPQTPHRSVHYDEESGLHQEQHGFSSENWATPPVLSYGPAIGQHGYQHIGQPAPTLVYQAHHDEAPVSVAQATVPVAFQAAQPVQNVQHQVNAETEPSLESKPYAALIYQALMEAPAHKMVLQDLYNWFRANTGKVAASGASKGWQNSIRHNLSMNEAFVKLDGDLPSIDARRTFMWALHPDAVGKGFVESTTRYRKTAPNKRGGSRVQQAAATKAAVRRSTRKSSVKSVSASPKPERQPALAPMAAPMPHRPAPHSTLALEDAAMPSPQAMLPSYSQSSASTQHEGNVSCTNYDEEFHAGIATPGSPLDQQNAPVAAAAYREHPNMPPQAMQQLYPLSTYAWQPPSPESLFGGQNYDLAEDARAFMLNEFGPPTLISERPSRLETLLLNAAPCTPGRHSFDCWREFCRF